MLQIAFFGKSDIGLKRTTNEDDFVVNPEHRFGLVADGMGGAAAGELASRVFKDTAVEVFSMSGDRSEKETLELVQTAFRVANEKILAHIRKNPHHEGMGCTAEILAISENGFVVGHIGDSRTYRSRKGQLVQLTQDHSLVQKQINEGLITLDESRNHPHRSVILQAVGVREELALDTIRGRIVSGDLFLMCSDGLTDMVEDSLIHEVLSSESDLPQKVDSLIQLAKIAGGKDNITVVLSRIE